MLTSQSRPWRYTGRNTPALDALRRITVSLGNERERVVFIGGAIAPLLHTHAILPVVRPTKDVDAIVATATYADFGHPEDALRRSGFREPDRTSPDGQRFHAHKWVSPDGDELDLVPGGDHLGATGSRWDAYALASAEWVDLSTVESRVPAARHANAVAYLGLKWAAFQDRGRDDPRFSHDLEDIVALMLSRPSLSDEFSEAPEETRRDIARITRQFLDERDPEEPIYAQLAGLGQQMSAALPAVMAVLRLVANVDASRPE